MAALVMPGLPDSKPNILGCCATPIKMMMSRKFGQNNLIFFVLVLCNKRIFILLKQSQARKQLYQGV